MLTQFKLGSRGGGGGTTTSTSGPDLIARAKANTAQAEVDAAEIEIAALKALGAPEVTQAELDAAELNATNKRDALVAAQKLIDDAQDELLDKVYNTYADLPSPTTLKAGTVCRVTNDPNYTGLHIAAGVKGSQATHYLPSNRT